MSYNLGTIPTIAHMTHPVILSSIYPTAHPKLKWSVRITSPWSRHSVLAFERTFAKALETAKAMWANKQGAPPLEDAI